MFQKIWLKIFNPKTYLTPSPPYIPTPSPTPTWPLTSYPGVGVRGGVSRGKCSKNSQQKFSTLPYLPLPKNWISADWLNSDLHHSHKGKIRSKHSQHIHDISIRRRYLDKTWHFHIDVKAKFLPSLLWYLNTEELQQLYLLRLPFQYITSYAIVMYHGN